LDVTPVVAVSVTTVLTVTMLVGIEKPTVLVPAGTIIVTGGDTLVSELVSVTTTPPAAAIPEILTRPESVLPPCNVELETTKAVTTGASTRTVPTLLTDPVVAVMLTLSSAATGTVVTGNDTFVAPAGTTTDTGTVTVPDAEFTKVTVVPPSGACPVNVTFPVIGEPPAALTGLKATDRIAAGLIVIVNVLNAPFKLAFQGTTVSISTTGSVDVKVAVSDPAFTNTVAGAVTPARPFVMLTMHPLSGALPVSLTVPVTVVPPTGELLGNPIVNTRGASTFSVPLTDRLPVVPVIAMLVSTAVTNVDVVKIAVVAFPGTVTVAGTLTSGFALINVTTVPPEGAGDCSVTIPEVFRPPVTLAGVNVTERITGAAMTSVPDFVTPFTAARIDALTLARTGRVVTVTDAFIAPARIVTFAGTMASAMDVLSSTTTPPAGAGASMVIVATDDLPPATDVGKRVTEMGAGPRTVSGVVTVTPLLVALIVAMAFVAIGVVVTVKVAVIAPATTVTLAGTVAEVRLDESSTIRPPVGAGPDSVTVPVNDAPPRTDVGDTVTLAATGATTVSVTDLLPVPRVPVMATSVSATTGDVTASTFTLVTPAGTVAWSGKLMMAELALDKVTIVPPVGAAPSS